MGAESARSLQIEVRFGGKIPSSFTAEDRAVSRCIYKIIYSGKRGR